MSGPPVFNERWESFVAEPSVRNLASRGVVTQVLRDDRGRNDWTVSAAHVAAPVERLHRLLDSTRSGDARLLELVPMIDKVDVLESRADSTRVRMQLRYKFFVLSMRFHFVADLRGDGVRGVAIDYVSGSVRDVQLRFRALPAAVGTDASVFVCAARYDVASLGFLADHFLKHHPEIETSIFAGTSITVAQTVQDRVVGPG